MVTATDNTAAERVMHPTREGFTASAYYVLGHVLGLVGLLATVGFLCWYGLHPTSVVGWVGLAFIAGVWTLGRLRRWASLSAWAEVPGAYRVYSVAAGDRIDTPDRRPVFWDYFFGLARFLLGVAGGAWLASRGAIEPDVRAVLLAISGGFLVALSAWRNVTDVFDGSSSWRVQRYGELLLDAAPLGMGVAWVVAGIQVDDARPVLGLAVSIVLLTFTFLFVFRMMRSTFRSATTQPSEEAMQNMYAALAQHRTEQGQSADDGEVLGWWATWRKQLPLTLVLTAGIATLAFLNAGLMGALVTAGALLLTSTVVAPLGYRVAQGPRDR